MAGAPSMRIALLSPTSGNLGNAAMQTAMIATLRARVPGVRLVSITLDPEDARRRHGVDAFPLAGVSRPFYVLHHGGDVVATTSDRSTLHRMKRWLKAIPLLYKPLKAFRTVGLETAHVVSAARLLARLDAIIVPGGGALDDYWGGPWGHPWNLFKWSVMARLFGVQVMFVSIGKCSLDSALSRLLIRAALALSTYRSYRDPQSKVEAGRLGGAKDDPVYPDLAFSYPSSSLPRRPRAGRELLIGVSPIAFLDPRSWPRHDQVRYDRYVAQLAALVRWLLDARHRVLFFTTDRADAPTVEDVRTLCLRDGRHCDRIETLDHAFEMNAERLLGALAEVDLVVASRLHATILPHVIGVPVLALSFDAKVAAHMALVGHAEYCLNISELTLDSLVERFMALSAARDREGDKLVSLVAGFREQLDQQYDRIAALLFRGNRPVAGPGGSSSRARP